MTSLKRHCESKIRQLLKQFPAVILLGVRQCGKTYLSKNLYPKWKYFDLENLKDRDFITRDFDFFFKEFPKHVILDEVQEVPELFKNLRSVIDQNRKQNNRFLITGSSSLELIT
ncbi:MAG: AAA family ATPase [Bdellovibrionales bacterium]|nr:AAA family ATPase [Bdellovibrionales bacterium]